MVVYNHECNAIISEPLKKSALKQPKTTKKVYTYLNKRGIQPRMYIMDNECPDVVKSFLQKRVSSNLVPPNIH